MKRWFYSLAAALWVGGVCAGTPQDVASQISSSAAQKSGSKNAINQNVISPLSGGGKLTTYDGKDSFNFSIGTCSNTEEILRMMTQPLPSGRIKILSFEQDTTLDGTLDRRITANQEADIVCANGFMRCSNVDDFSTCSSYSWQAASDNALSIKRVGMSDLGACYCISGKCGDSLAWRNLDHVLTDLASGAANALAARQPYYTLSGVEIDGVTALVRGGDANCATGEVNELFASKNPDEYQNYLNDPNALQSDAGNTDSPAFDMIQEGALNPNETSEYRSCSVTRSPIIDSAKIQDIIAFDGGAGGVGYCGEDCIQLTLGTVGDNYWSGWCTDYYRTARFFVKKPERIQSAVLQHAVFDDWIQITAGGSYVWSGPYNNWTGSDGVPGACELSTSWNMNPNVDFTRHIKKQGVVDFGIRVNVSGEGEGYAYAQIRADLTCKDTAQDNFSDVCRVYQSDPDCTLIEETVDDVKTFYNGAITGLSPLPQTKRMSQDSCQIDITRPWFKKVRKYRCDTKTDQDLTKMIARSEKIKSTTTSTDYQDIRYENGGVVGDSGTLDFSNLPSVSPCTQACKVRVPIYPDVTLDGVNTVSKEPARWDVVYRECSEVSTCTVNPGEELVTACQCTDDFAEAVAIMQIMRQAGKDMICSSGVPQQL